MNIELFKSKVAGTVATKIGIHTDQASLIVDHVLRLANKSCRETHYLPELGEIVLINRESDVQPDEFVETIDIPYETTATFKVGQTYKEVTFVGLQNALHKPIEPYKLEWVGGALHLISALEGNPVIPPIDDDPDVNA